MNHILYYIHKLRYVLIFYYYLIDFYKIILLAKNKMLNYNKHLNSYNVKIKLETIIIIHSFGITSNRCIMCSILFTHLSSLWQAIYVVNINLYKILLYYNMLSIYQNIKQFAYTNIFQGARLSFIKATTFRFHVYFYFLSRR